MRKWTARPCEGRSVSRRSYRLWTCDDRLPHSGQAASAASGLAMISRRSGSVVTASTRRPAGEIAWNEPRRMAAFPNRANELTRPAPRVSQSPFSMPNHTRHFTFLVQRPDDADALAKATQAVVRCGIGVIWFDDTGLVVEKAEATRRSRPDLEANATKRLAMLDAPAYPPTMGRNIPPPSQDQAGRARLTDLRRHRRNVTGPSPRKGTARLPRANRPGMAILVIAVYP